METIGEDLRQMIRTPLSPSHVEALRAAGRVVTYPKGTIMVQQGEKANRFVYVEEGEIEVVNPFTGEKMMFKAKPASKKVRVMPLKSLKAMVNS